MATVAVRAATVDDAAACARVYAPYVTATAITFETEPPSAGEMAERIAAARRTHAWLVAEAIDGTVVGYAYAGPYKTRAAYRWSCETSVYLQPGERRRGAGRALYEALLEHLAERGFLLAVASMTVPNEASAGLHAALGFTSSGVLREVGWKAGRWHDVELLQRRLAPPPTGPPAEPR